MMAANHFVPSVITHIALVCLSGNLGRGVSIHCTGQVDWTTGPHEV